MRTMAWVLVLLALASSQPAHILHSLLHSLARGLVLLAQALGS